MRAGCSHKWTTYIHASERHTDGGPLRMNPVERAGPVMGSLLRNNSTTEAAKRPFRSCGVEDFHPGQLGWSVHDPGQPRSQSPRPRSRLTGLAGYLYEHIGVVLFQKEMGPNVQTHGQTVTHRQTELWHRQTEVTVSEKLISPICHSSKNRWMNSGNKSRK